MTLGRPAAGPNPAPNSTSHSAPKTPPPSPPASRKPSPSLQSGDGHWTPHQLNSQLTSSPPLPSPAGPAWPRRPMEGRCRAAGRGGGTSRRPPQSIAAPLQVQPRQHPGDQPALKLSPAPVFGRSYRRQADPQRTEPSPRHSAPRAPSFDHHPRARRPRPGRYGAVQSPATHPDHLGPSFGHQPPALRGLGGQVGACPPPDGSLGVHSARHDTGRTGGEKQCPPARPERPEQEPRAFPRVHLRRRHSDSGTSRGQRGQTAPTRQIARSPSRTAATVIPGGSRLRTSTKAERRPRSGGQRVPSMNCFPPGRAHRLRPAATRIPSRASATAVIAAEPPDDQERIISPQLFLLARTPGLRGGSVPDDEHVPGCSPRGPPGRVQSVTTSTPASCIRAASLGGRSRAVR